MGRRQFDPPTQKQLSYAARLGIHVTANMDKHAVSAAISERVDELLLQKRFPHLVPIYRNMRRAEEERKEVLIAFKRGKKYVADVVLIHNVYVDEDQGGFELDCEGTKIRKDRTLGQYLEWEKELEVPVKRLAYCRVLEEEIDMFDIRNFQRLIADAILRAESGEPLTATATAPSSPFRSEEIVDAQLVRDEKPPQPSVWRLVAEFALSAVATLGFLLIWLWETTRGPLWCAAKKTWAWCVVVWRKMTAPIVAYYRKYK